MRIQFTWIIKLLAPTNPVRTCSGFICGLLPVTISRWLTTIVLNRATIPPCTHCRLQLSQMMTPHMYNAIHFSTYKHTPKRVLRRRRWTWKQGRAFLILWMCGRGATYVRWCCKKWEWPLNIWPIKCLVGNHCHLTSDSLIDQSHSLCNYHQQVDYGHYFIPLLCSILLNICRSFRILRYLAELFRLV